MHLCKCTYVSVYLGVFIGKLALCVFIREGRVTLD